MDTSSYLVSSDIASGVVAAVMQKLSCKVSNAKLWRPFVENVVLSIMGRMGETYLSGAWFSRAAVGNTAGTPYIKTDEGRSSIIIAISSMMYTYIMKSSNPYEHVALSVSSDVLGSSIVQALFAKDGIWWAPKP